MEKCAHQRNLKQVVQWASGLGVGRGTGAEGEACSNELFDLWMRNGTSQTCFLTRKIGGWIRSRRFCPAIRCYSFPQWLSSILTFFWGGGGRCHFICLLTSWTKINLVLILACPVTSWVTSGRFLYLLICFFMLKWGHAIARGFL